MSAIDVTFRMTTGKPIDTIDGESDFSYTSSAGLIMPTIERIGESISDEGTRSNINIFKYPNSSLQIISEYAQQHLEFRTLRYGAAIGGFGLLLSLLLLSIGYSVGLVIFFATIGLIGLAFFAFWMDTGIEIFNLRVLVVLTITAFGTSISTFLALLL